MSVIISQTLKDAGAHIVQINVTDDDSVNDKLRLI